MFFINEKDIEKNELSPNNIKKSLFVLSKDFSYDMPFEIRKEILNWKVVSKSPYSFSFYNITNKSWDDSFEKEFLRVSDHWNFFKQDYIHCRTEDGNNYKGYFSVGKFNPKSKKYKLDESSISKCIDKMSNSELKINVQNLEKDEDFVFAVKKVLSGKIKEKNLQSCVTYYKTYYRNFFYTDDKNVLHVKEKILKFLTIS